MANSASESKDVMYEGFRLSYDEGADGVPRSADVTAVTEAAMRALGGVHAALDGSGWITAQPGEEQDFFDNARKAIDRILGKQARELKTLDALRDMVAAEVRKFPEYKDVTPLSAYKHELDETGCNWDVNHWSGPQPEVTWAHRDINAAMVVMRARFNAM